MEDLEFYKDDADVFTSPDEYFWSPMPGYSLVCIFREGSEVEFHLRQYFNLFNGCKSDCAGRPTNTEPLYKITRISGGPATEKNMIRSGLFVRTNAPLWVIDSANDLKKILKATVAPNGCVPILVDSPEAFDAWLGETPHVYDFVNDLILMKIAREQIADNIKQFESAKYGWDIFGKEFLLPLQIYAVQGNTVALRLFPSFNRILHIGLDINLNDFRKRILDGQLTLVSALTSGLLDSVKTKVNQ